MPYKMVEFFAGIGLARMGMKEDWEVVMANDFSKDKGDIYEMNFQDNHFILKDINELESVEIPEADLAWASFPCQDLSLAGYRKGMAAERSGTFWAFWRLMKEKKTEGKMPSIIVIENVEGLLSDKDFNGLCHSLAALELQFGFLVMDAAHFVPQSRKRVFVVAIDAKIDVSKFVHETPPTKDAWISKGVLKAFDNLDPQLKSLWRWWNLESYVGDKKVLEDIIELAPPDVQDHSPAMTQSLLSMMTEKNLEKIELAKRQETFKVGTLYKRIRNKVQRAEVRFDGIAGCLRTPKGGSSIQTIVLVNKGEIKTRLISIREAARLMGVPDEYKLPESRTKALYGMGDAVVVPVVEWLSKGLLVPLMAEYRKQNLEQKAELYPVNEHMAYFNEWAELGLKKWEEGAKSNVKGSAR